MTMARFLHGDHVKIEVADERSGDIEWVWLLVDHCDEEHQVVFGQLDSEPVVATNYEEGTRACSQQQNRFATTKGLLTFEKSGCSVPIREIECIEMTNTASTITVAVDLGDEKAKNILVPVTAVGVGFPQRQQDAALSILRWWARIPSGKRAFKKLEK